jgi:hypothetical protein
MALVQILPPAETASPGLGSRGVPWQRGRARTALRRSRLRGGSPCCALATAPVISAPRKQATTCVKHFRRNDGELVYWLLGVHQN